MKNIFDKTVMDRVVESGIIAVLEIENEEHAVPTTQALVRGGVTAIELTLRTPAAIPSIRLIKESVPEMTIGIGTVLFQEQIDEIVAAGAHFGVSPGLNSKIVEYAAEKEFPFAPGILTPSELELAISLGCSTVKFFPAERSGGVEYLKSMNAPYNYLGLSYIPLGGITANNLPEYAAFKNITAIGGSWIAKRDVISKMDWAEIEDRAAKAKDIWDTARK